MVNTLKIKKFLAVFCAAVLFLGVFAPIASAAEPVQVDSEGIYVTELESGSVLKQQKYDTPFYPGSITKLMALYVMASACYNGKAGLDDIIAITPDVMSSDSGVIPLKEGEEFTLEQLMYLMYMDYSDTAAFAAAVHVSGSYEAFVSEMNKTARELKMTNTSFVNILGTFNEEHYTTAEDLVVFLQAAIKNTVFFNIFTNTTYIVSDTNKSISRSLVTSNALQMRSSAAYTDKCCGGRSGGFSEYGFASVSLSETQDSGMKLIVVTFGNETRDGANKDASTLIEWTYDNFSWHTIITANEAVAKVPLAMGDGTDYVSAVPADDVVVMLDNNISTDRFKREIVIYSEMSGETLTAPISRGEILGELTISYNNTALGHVKLVANNNVDLARWVYLKNEMDKTFKSSGVYWAILVVLILVVLYLIYSLIFYILRVVRYFKRRQAKKELLYKRDLINDLGVQVEESSGQDTEQTKLTDNNGFDFINK